MSVVGVPSTTHWQEDRNWALSKSSHVKLLITNNAFCIVQRATAQSKTGIFRDYGIAEAPPGFQAGWSDSLYFFSLSFCSSCPLIWVFRVSFCTHEVTLPYRSCAQMSCREEVGVSFVVLGVLEPQAARHWFRSAAISRHLTNSVGRSLLLFQSSAPVHLWASKRSRIVDSTSQDFSWGSG
jgi:hypothetical protein